MRRMRDAVFWPVVSLYLDMVAREGRPFQTAPTPPEGLLLEFGCGEKPRDGYIGVDVRDLPHVKYVCDAWEIDRHVEPQSVGAIYSCHFLEHLTPAQAGATLQSWMKILKPGGLVETVVPDMTFHVRQWLHPERTRPRSKGGDPWQEQARAGIWGGNATGELWDLHKCGYDFKLLCDRLTEAGFVDVARMKNRPRHLHVICRKPA